MSDKTNLAKAKSNKNDEFYTQYNDISNELVRYKDQLRGKFILCPCDWDAEQRTIFDEEDFNYDKCNFSKFLNAHFKDYGIKSITISGYNPATKFGKPFQVAIPEFAKKHPTGVVITNPPFSLFREFIETIMQFPRLKFLIIGNKNALTYKEIFNLIKDNKIWVGYSSPKIFASDTSENKNTFIKDGKQYAKFGNIGWFTNLDVDYRKDELILTESYSPDKFPKYDNYDAINIDKIGDIPYDYDGIMGVPITFLDSYNPNQFEIIGITKTPLGNHLRTKIYDRQTQYKVGFPEETKTVMKLNDGPAILVKEAPTKFKEVYYTIGNLIYISKYARILIKRKK